MKVSPCWPWFPAISGASGSTAKYLSRHVLFLGGIGTGKSNAMYQLLDPLRRNAGRDDVFVIFDTKGDFLEKFYRDGDAVISSTPDRERGGVTWNLFSDLLEQDANALGEQVHEIASTVFSEGFEEAGENIFFAMAARDIFAAVVETLAAAGQELLQRGHQEKARIAARGVAGTAGCREQPPPGRGGPVPRG